MGQDKYDGLNRPYLMGEVKPPANEKMQMLLKVAEEFSAVSYTHLDVYKRQVFTSLPEARTCIGKSFDIRHYDENGYFR